MKTDKINELIKTLCPNGVSFSKLSNHVDISKGVQLNKDLLMKKGIFPVINGGIYPSGYWNEFNVEANTITISQGGASAGYVNKIKSEF